MKFTRTHLIDIITTALDQDDIAKSARVAAEEAAKAQYLTEWTSTAWPQWKAYRDELSRLIKRGNPIVPGDVPEVPAYFQDTGHGNRYSRSYQLMEAARKSSPRRMTDERRTELTALVATLKAIHEDEVTDAQLGRLGFGASVISCVFRAATDGQGY